MQERIITRRIGTVLSIGNSMGMTVGLSSRTSRSTSATKPEGIRLNGELLDV